MNIKNEFAAAKFKQTGLFGRLYQHLNFAKLPLCLQTNLYVAAQKGKS